MGIFGLWRSRIKEIESVQLTQRKVLAGQRPIREFRPHELVTFTLRDLTAMNAAAPSYGMSPLAWRRQLSADLP